MAEGMEPYTPGEIYSNGDSNDYTSGADESLYSSVKQLNSYTNNKDGSDLYSSNSQPSDSTSSGRNFTENARGDFILGNKDDVHSYNEHQEDKTADFYQWSQDNGIIGHSVLQNLIRGTSTGNAVLNLRSKHTRERIISDLDPAENINYSYKHIIDAFDSGKMNKRDAQKAVSRIKEMTGDNGKGFNPASFRDANLAFDIGIIDREQLEDYWNNGPKNPDKPSPEYESTSPHSNGWNGSEDESPEAEDSAGEGEENSRGNGESGGGRDHPFDYDHTKLDTFRHTSWATMKLTGKMAGKGVKLSGKLGYQALRGLNYLTNAQIGGGAGNFVLNDISRSGVKIGGKLVRAGTNSINALNRLIRSYVSFRKSIWTDKDEAKLSKIEAKRDRAAKKGHRGAERRANRKGQRMQNRRDKAHRVEGTKSGAFKSIAKVGGAKALQGAPLKGAKTVKSAGGFGLHQVSKMTTEAFGATDSTFSQMSTTAKKMMKAPRKAFNIVKRTVRIAKKVGQVAKTVAHAVKVVVQAVVHVVSSIVNFLISNPIGWGIIGIAVGVILIMLLFGSCTGETSMLSGGVLSSLFTTREGIARQCANMYQEYTDYWYKGLGIYGTDNGGDAAYTTYERIFKEYEELQEFGIVPEDDREFDWQDYEAINTTWHKTFDPQWFNPYCLLAYLEVKYGEFDISYMEAELDPTNEDSIFWNQYTIERFEIIQSQSSLGLWDEDDNKISNPENTFGMSIENMIDQYATDSYTDEDGNVSYTCAIPQTKAYLDNGEEYIENGEALSTEQLANLFQQAKSDGNTTLNEDGTEQATVEYTNQAGITTTLFIKEENVIVRTKPIDNYDIYIEIYNNGFNNTAMQLLGKMSNTQSEDDEDTKETNNDINYSEYESLDPDDYSDMQRQYLLKCYTYGECNNYNGEQLDDEEQEELDQAIEDGELEEKTDSQNGKYYTYPDDEQNVFVDEDGNEHTTYTDPLTGEEVEYEQRFYVDNTNANNSSNEDSEDSDDDDNADDDESYGYWWPLVYAQGDGVNAGLYEYITHPETHGEKKLTCADKDELGESMKGEEVSFNDFCLGSRGMDGFDIDNPNGSFSRQESETPYPWGDEITPEVKSGAGFGVLDNITVDNNYGFAWPLTDNFYVSSQYGTRRVFLTSGGVSSSKHWGIDISAANGTDVVAAYDGTIEEFQRGDNEGRGWYVVLKHNVDGVTLYTLYQHLSSFVGVPYLDDNWNVVTDAFGEPQYRFQKGDKVKRGTVIATVGETGNVSGPHLHYEVHTFWPDLGNAHTNFPLDYYSDLLEYNVVSGYIGNCAGMTLAEIYQKYGY